MHRPLALVALLTLSIAHASAGDGAGKSVTRGRTLFIRTCAGCHGNDGKALMDAGGDATDLTNPKVYRHGTTDAAILASIRDGANGMPAFKSELKDEEMRSLLDFIHSLWKQ